MFLRIYANCADEDAAALSGALQMALAHLAPTPAAEPRQYWKMPELFEFTYRLSSHSLDAWIELGVQSSNGWLILEDEHERSAVWNRRDDRVFLVPAVRWAELAGQP